MDDGIDISERMLRAIVGEMLRANIIPTEVLTAAADRAERDDDTDVARSLRFMVIEALSPEVTQSDFEADRARNRFRSIDGGKLGD